MHINKINLKNNFNKVQFKQKQDDKNKYIYVEQASIDNFKLPLGMGLIYSQFEFNRTDKEVKEIFKQKLDDFKSKTFAKKCKSILILLTSVIGLALASEAYGFKKQFKIEKKDKENDETTLKKGLMKKGAFETIIISSVVGVTSDYILKKMKNQDKAMTKSLVATAATMAVWGIFSLVSGINTFKNYKKQKDNLFS